MSLGNIIMVFMEEGVLGALPYLVDTLVTGIVTITALVLAILAYRNTRKILKKLNEKKDDG